MHRPISLTTSGRATATFSTRRAGWDRRGHSGGITRPKPTACFFRELLKAYPAARFVLTVRDPEKWADSFAATIYKLIGKREHAPPDKQAWLEMAARIIARTGFPPGLDQEALASAYVAHNEAVKATIPREQLLVYEVTDGWAALCEFLGTEVPKEPFPRTNHRAEFWDRVTGKI